MNLQRLSKRLVLLTENKGVPKYVDRDLVDYWRTVQGTNVGFHGKVPGEGIPIAGPPVLTGGSGSGNPLLDPLLNKYKAGTFTGDAIRKKNFPLSLAVFFDNVLGTEKQIKTDMDKLLKSQEASGKYPSGYLTKRFAGKGAAHSKAYALINENFGSSSGNFSYVAKHLNTLGVSGSFAPYDPARDMTTEQLHKRLNAMGTSPEALTEVIRDVYLLNQAILRKKGISSEEVTRGLGTTIPGLDSEGSMAFIMEAKNKGISVRIAGHRASASTATGGTTTFAGFGFQSVDIPIEAALSSWNGTRIQGAKFPHEKEVMMMGLADLAIEAKHLTNQATVAGTSEALNKQVAAQAASGAAIAASGGAVSAPLKSTGGPTTGSELSASQIGAMANKYYGDKVGPYLAKTLAYSKGKAEIAAEAYMEGYVAAKTLNDIDTDLYSAAFNEADKNYKEARANLPAFAAVAALAQSNDMDKPLGDLTIGYLATATGIAVAELEATSLSSSQIKELEPKVKDYLTEGNFKKKPPASTPFLDRIHALAKQGPTGDLNGALFMSNDERAGLMAAEFLRATQFGVTDASKTVEKFRDLYEENPWLKGVRLRPMGGMIDDKNIANVNDDTTVNSTLSGAIFGVELMGDLFMNEDQIALALGYAKKFGVDRADAVRQFSDTLDALTSDSTFSASDYEENGPVSKAVYDAVMASTPKGKLQDVIKGRAQKKAQVFAKFNPGFNV